MRTVKINGKIVLLSAFAYLLTLATPSLSAHDEKGHTKEIGEVFGMKSAKGEDLASKIGEVIADFIDGKPHEIHQRINRKIWDICCDKKYYSLYVARDNQKKTDLRRRLSIVESQIKKASSEREIVDNLLWISKEMQNDSFFNRQNCSVVACNVEGTLNKLQKALDYKHEIPKKDLIESFRKLKNCLDDDIGRSQLSFREFQEHIKELAGKEKLFQWGSYYHRLYFHWGMDERIEFPKFKPLKNRVDRSCEDLRKLLPNDEKNRSRIDELLKEVQNTIYRLIEEEWARRYREAENKIYSLLKCSNPDKFTLNDAQCHMILEMAYYVHILGDYTTTVTSPLVEEKSIREALSKILTDDLWGHKDGNRKMTDIQNRLMHRDTAEEMLNFLKAEIPDLIDGSPKIRDVLW